MDKTSKTLLFKLFVFFLTFSLRADVETSIPGKDLLRKMFTFHQSKSKEFFQFTICKNTNCKTLVFKTFNEKVIADFVSVYIFLNKQAVDWNSDPRVVKYFKENLKSTKCNNDLSCTFDDLKRKYGVKILNSELYNGSIVIKPDGYINFD